MRELIQIRNKLSKLGRDYDTLSQEYNDVAHEASDLREIYDLEKAEAMLDATGTIPEKAARVAIACQGSSARCHTAEAREKFYLVRLKAVSALLNAAQTEAALIKEEMKL